MWKVVVGVVMAAAATTVIVASCHDRGSRARHELTAPAYVETTSAEVVGADVSIAGVGREPAIEAAAPIAAPTVTVPPAITGNPPTPGPTPGAAAATGAPPSTNDSAGTAIVATTSTSTADTTTDAAAPPPAVPTATPPPAGAGRFITEAPYWGSSAFPSNPEAGAGPFTQ